MTVLCVRPQVLFDDGVAVQLTLAILICAWSHVLHAMYKPWKHGVSTVHSKAQGQSTSAGRRLYAVQHFALLVLFFT
jgi:hypothetical protein